MNEACPLCGESASVRTEDEVMGIHACSGCRHMFTVLPPDDQEQYDEDYFVDAHKNWFAHPNYALFEFISNRITTRFGTGSGARILDIGCGKGDFLNYLHARDTGLQLTGIDLTSIPDPSFTYIQGDFMSQTFDEPFDAAVSLAVIEHLDDPAAFLAAVKRAVRPGGLVFIMTNNNESIIYRMARMLKRWGFRVAFERLYLAHHVNHFSNTSLLRAVRSAGLEVECVHNHNYPIRAVDVPAAPAVVQWGYKAAVLAMFALEKPLGGGFLQTVCCRNT